MAATPPQQQSNHFPTMHDASYRHRLDTLQSSLQPQQAILLSSANDVRYYAGFNFLVPEEREGLLLVTSDAVYILQASFSPVTTPDWIQCKFSVYPQRVGQHVAEIAREHDLQELWADYTSLFVAELHAIQSKTNLTLTALDRELIWQQRMQKNESEITAAREAARIAAESWEAVLPRLQPGLTEREFKEILEEDMRQHGSEERAFPTIVAFGEHGALPHYQPSDTPLEAEMPILVDFGATYQHYRSDITRSIWFGENPSEKFLDIQTLIHDAYAAAVACARRHSTEEISAADVDRAARNPIEDAGYGDQFFHTTGHGLGLDIHEQPSLHSNNDQLIQPGMLITIEPGIYLEGEFGYRYENTVLVTEDGVAEITRN